MEKTKTKKLATFFLWLKRHRKLSLLAGSFVILTGSGVSAFFILNSQPEPVASAPVESVKPAPVPEPEPVKYYSPLSGALVSDEAATKQAVTAIMIENSPDARPQSGLKGSGVVFEAIAEGGITRFLALYQEGKPQLIGPVRSVRMYYVDWLAAFNASVAHVGGSVAALSEVRSGTYRDIDQFFNANTYWRATDRSAPHNVYTSFAKLDALNAAKGYSSSTFTGFERKDPAPSTTPTATKINVVISSALYNSAYVYKPETNSYDRSQAGAPHIDREGGQLSPSAVVVLKVPMQLVLEDGYREQITTIGSGPVTIFQDGGVIEGTWHKDSKTEQLYFTDAAGARIKLVRGQTWVTAISNKTGAVSWQ
ncbi:MAG: uncharacterized protein JWN33_562 [Candidatus Saccharibacteria bacterium]|nr:uncharacterized protein [Candidatus Saccharibacteria bacterium]